MRRTLSIAGLALVFIIGIWAGDQFNSWAARIAGAASGVTLAGVLGSWLARRPSVRNHTRAGLLRLGLFSLAVLLLGMVILTLTITYNRAQAFVHPARSAASRTPASVGINDYREVSFAAEDGMILRGWYIPPRNGGLIIYTNGHGFNRSAFLYHAALMAKQGYGGLLYDLRNTGESDGTFTTMGYYESRDVIAAVRFAKTLPEVDPHRIALLGDSMGGSATLLALPNLPEVKGVVIECSFSTLQENIDASVRNLGLPEFPFGRLVAYFGERETGMDINAVRPVDSLAGYDRPLLIIHGQQDDLLPVRNAYALYDAANQPKELYIVPSGGHCGFETAEPEEYPRRLVAFFRSVLQ